MEKSFYKSEKKNILEALEKFRVSEIEYSLTLQNNISPFSTIFSVFIKDLFNYNFEFQKNQLVDYIQSFQDIETGLFVNRQLNEKPNFYSKSCLQLTSFSLSALSILGSKPKYKINHNINTKEKIFSYLDKVGVKKGSIGSGNFAMFLGIFLTVDKLLDSSNKNLYHWFDYHDENRNPNNGFWTKGLKGKSQWAYQNAVHQIAIYKFSNQPIANYKSSVDMVINHCDKNSTFALLPGGGACWDYDAIHILNYLGYKNHYRINDIKYIFNNTFNSILKIKDETGFCENSYVQKISIKNNINQFYQGRNILSSLFRVREFIISKNNNFTHQPGWSNKPIKLSECDLWSMWFRLLTIAEIEKTLDKKTKWKFHNFPGLGYF